MTLCTQLSICQLSGLVLLQNPPPRPEPLQSLSLLQGTTILCEMASEMCGWVMGEGSSLILIPRPG